MSATTAMIRAEGKLLLRSPGVVAWTVILPIAGSIILASIPATREPQDYLHGSSFFSAYQPVLILFVVSLLAVQALPDVLTRYREMGILKRLRTTPVSPTILLVAQYVLMVGISLACAVVMVVVPGLIGAGWPRNFAGLLIAFLLAAAAFMGLGTMIAALFHNAKVAAGFGTVLFFVLQFFGGLWIQIQAMPVWLRTISGYTPSGAASQALAESATGFPAWQHLVVLVVWAAVTFFIAVRTFKWE